MKACRFIMNTDYAMFQQDGETTLSVNIPASWVQPHGAAAQVVKYTDEKTLVGSSSENYRIYLTSTAFNYAVENGCTTYLKFGDDLIHIEILRSRDKFKLVVYGDKPSFADKTYSGTAQTITAHIVTFKDPFSEK